MSFGEAVLYIALAAVIVILFCLVVFAIIEGSMYRKADAKIRAYKTKGQL